MTKTDQCINTLYLFCQLLVYMLCRHYSDQIYLQVVNYSWLNFDWFTECCWVEFPPRLQEVPLNMRRRNTCDMTYIASLDRKTTGASWHLVGLDSELAAGGFGFEFWFNWAKKTTRVKPLKTNHPVNVGSCWPMSCARIVIVACHQRWSCFYLCLSVVLGKYLMNQWADLNETLRK